MDLTVLELGLRNRQLLQVKCFLKIKVETFRCILTEELPQLKPIDRVSLLEKFFLHDWKNVINKVTSVAVVNMTGEYSSKLFAVSLFRSVIQSCNQLILIVSSFNLSELDEDKNVFSEEPTDLLVSSLSFSSNSSSQSASLSQTFAKNSETEKPKTFKEKIIRILIKQIHSITGNLEKSSFVNSMNFSVQSNIPSLSEDIEESNSKNMLQSKTNSWMTNLLSHYSNLDEYDDTSLHLDSLNSLDSELLLEYILNKGKISLFQCIMKNNELSKSNVNDTNRFISSKWQKIVQNTVKIVSKQLKSSDISTQFIEQLNFIFSQIGLSSQYLFFCIFIQTCDSVIRQKLLQLFFKQYDNITNLEKSIQQDIASLKTDNDKKNLNIDKVDFARYLKIMSIIDMYIFCFRPKLDALVDFDISIEWVLNLDSELSLVKSFILPILEEMQIHTELFVDWKEMNRQMYCNLLCPLHQYFFQETDFALMISAESLWQYWIDSNKTKHLLDWVKHGSANLPYCPNIRVSNDFDLCKSMVNYLQENGSEILKRKLMQSLCWNSNLFYYTLYELSPEYFNFQTLLSYVSEFDDFMDLLKNNDLDNLLDNFVQTPSKPYFELSKLLEYCIENELYEFLFHLYIRYRDKIDEIILIGGKNISSFLSEKSVNLIQFLSNFISDRKKDFVFENSLLVYRILNYKESYSAQLSSKEDLTDLILKHLIINSDDVELILLIISFSKVKTFDNISALVNDINKADNSHDKFYSARKFLSILNSKYPIIYQSFEWGTMNEAYPTLPLLSSTPEKPSTNIVQQKKSIDPTPTKLSTVTALDIYSLLQQAIPFLNVSKFFRFQVKRRIQRARTLYSPDFHNSSLPDQLLLSPVEANSTSLENSELPHFSQKRLSELYGLRAELTGSYYLKNSRPLEAFFKFFKLKKIMDKPARSRDMHSVLNEKLALKVTRKATLIAYNFLRQKDVFSSCLLFQSLVKTVMSSENDKFTNKKPNSNKNDTNISIEDDLNNEISKTAIHLSIAKLILEYAPDFLALQGAQQQQTALFLLLKKSHFNRNRTSSRKLLDLAVIAIDRKYQQSFSSTNSNSYKLNKSNNATNSSLNMTLHSLYLEPSDDPKLVQNIYDNSFIDSDMSKFESLLMFECYDWKPIFQFADLHGLKKPLNFLTKCAQQDNWLTIVIFAQLYEIPKEDIQVFLRDATFNNHCIGEHLTKVFQSSHQTSKNFSGTDSKLVKRKNAPDSSRNDLYSRLFKGKVVGSQAADITSNKSADQYSIHSQSNVSNNKSDLISNDEQSVFYIDASSPETVSLGSQSMFSKLSEDSGPSLLVLFEQHLTPQSVPKDFIQLILEVYQNCVYYSSRANSSWKYSAEMTFRTSLLYTSVSISNPILALLACSLEKTLQTPNIEIKSPSISPLNTENKNNSNANANLIANRLKFTSFMCWLLASVKPCLKQMFIDLYLKENPDIKKEESKQSVMTQCYLQWSPDRSLHLIDILTKKDAQIFRTLFIGFQVFDLQISILQTLLEFLIRFFIEKDYYQSNDLLTKFQSLLLNYNEEEFMLSKNILISNETFEDDGIDNEDFLNNYGSLRIFYSKQWIEKCSLVLITNSLLLAQQFELVILLSYYNFTRIQDSFQPNYNRIPDFRRLYLFSQCLSKLSNFTLPIADLLVHSSTNEGVDDSQFVDILGKLILDLQEFGHFDEARNIINLLTKANTNEFIINEWMLKAKKVENNIETNYSSKEVKLNKIDMTFWENCWSQVTRLDPTMHSAFKVMERFVQHLEPNQIFIKCFVLLKCLLAVETILNDHIENEDDIESLSQYDFNDSSTVSSNNVNFSYLGLVDEYYQFEEHLWQAVVEGEYFIQCAAKENGNDDNQNSEQSSLNDSNDTDIFQTWHVIWIDIISYVKSSLFSSKILSKLSPKSAYVFKNLRNKNKNSSFLEDFKCDALNRVIGKLLDFVCIQKAKDVAQIFYYKHEDFDIIEACDNVARGSLKSLSDLPINLQIKIQKSNISNPIEFVDSFSPISAQNLNDDQKRIISTIQTFINFSTIGKKSCEFILLYYKISCILEITYDNLKDSYYSPVKLFSLLLASYQPDLISTSFSKSVLDHGSSNLFSSNHSYSELNLNNNDGENNQTDNFKLSQSAADQSYQSFFINRYNESLACAKDLIRIFGYVDEQLNTEERIADIIAENVYQNVKNLVDSQFDDKIVSSSSNHGQNSLVSEIEIDKNRISLNLARFRVLIRLLHEPSILGHKLIDICRKEKANFEHSYDSSPMIYSNIENTNRKSSKLLQAENDIDFVLIKRKLYFMLVELYIRAHECFTTQCDVRGIALVLRKTRLLITQDLQPSSYFHLIIRFLTGIGRYSEMTYCFDLFRESDRFEMILSKRVQRTPQLRIALLNYLKNAEHVEELLPLVAIRFFLFRETADYHRFRAERLLSEISAKHCPKLSLSQSNSFNKLSLSSIGFSSSFKGVSTSLSDYGSSATLPTILCGEIFDSLKDQLETIMYEYQEAEYNYTKASAHQNANYCALKAHLIALQLSYLHRSKNNISQLSTSTNANTQLSVPFILNLDTIQVKEYVYHCSQFYEALIVSQGYPDSNIDWVDSFLYNVILNNNMSYLVHYSSSFKVTLSFLEKLVKRYEQLTMAFNQQQQQSKNRNRSNISYSSPSLSNSPSSSSFVSLMNHIRSDFELKKIRQGLEQLLERFLCQSNDSNIPSFPISDSSSLKEKYLLAKRFGSAHIMQLLLETDIENSAFLQDLKRKNQL